MKSSPLVTTFFAMAMAMAMAIAGAASTARADVLVFDEHDGRSGGTVGWAEDWPFSRSGGELVQTVGYPRRRFNAALGHANATLWVAVTGRMDSAIAGYAYHVPMGTTAWSEDYQYPGLHFNEGYSNGLADDDADQYPTGIAQTGKQTWLARYELGAELSDGRFDIFTSVWVGAGNGAAINVSSPPLYTRLIEDADLDSFYAGQDSDTNTYYVDRESVATSAQEALGFRRDLQLVAHQDDDLLFMNPDISRSIRSGTPLRTVYVTDGAAGDPAMITKRETGLMAAYAEMAGLPDAWSCGAITAAARNVELCTIDDQVSLVFVRIPATANTATFPVRQASDIDNSLERLWVIPSSTIADTYAGQMYTRAILIDTLADLIATFAPTRINTLDATFTHGWDHGEHFYSALFAQAARFRYTAQHDFQVYRGYNILYSNETDNLTSAELDAKLMTFRWYDACDRYICPNSTCGQLGCDPRDDTDEANDVYVGWSRRQYSLTTMKPGTRRLASRNDPTKCLTMGFANSLSLTACSSSSAQQFTLTPDHHLVASSGRCLAVASNVTTTALEPCSSAEGQHWTIYEDGPVIEDRGACLELAHGQPSSTTVDADWEDCNGYPLHKWSWIP